MNQQLVDYVKSQLEKGVQKDAILAELQSKGWAQEDIDSSMAAATEKNTSKISKENVSMKAVAQEEGPKDMFADVGTSDLKLNNGTEIKQQPMADTSINPPVAPMTSQAAESATARGVGKKIGIIIGGLFAVALLGVGGVFAYTRFFAGTDRVAVKVIEKLSSLEVAEIQLTVTPTLTDSGKESIEKLYPGFESGNLFLSGYSTFGTVENTADMTGGAYLTVNGKTETYSVRMRTVNENTYITLGELNIPFVDLSILEGKWIRFNADEIKEGLDNAGLGTDELNTQIDNAESQLTEAEMESIRQSFRENTFIELGESNGSEEIQGVTTKKYSVNINKEKAKSFLVALKPIAEKKGVSDEDFQKSLKQIDTWTIPVSNIWVDTAGNLFRAEMTFTNSEQGSQVESISVVLEMWNHNKWKSIEEPKESIGITEAIQYVTSSLFGGFDSNTVLDTEDSFLEFDASLEDLTEESSNTIDLDTINEKDDEEEILDDGTDTDEDGLTDIEEGIYGTDPELEDTDGDGFLDGDEVENGYNPNGEGKLLNRGAADRDAERISELRALASAMESYFADNARYPAIGDDWTDLSEDLSPYINSAQADPEDPEKAYTYVTNKEGTAFFLLANLEDPLNSALALDIDGEVGGEGFSALSSNDDFTNEAIDCTDPAFCIEN